jgi:TRAP-type mannitol/chloroaromatic compound transport system substrate-binding protein
MKRRDFLRVTAAGGVTAAAAAIAAPAIAQSRPEIKWRLTSSFPRSLDIRWAATELFAKYVGEFTDQRFTLQTFAAGEIVPGLQVLDSVSGGAVEAGYSPSLFYIGKDPAFAVGTTIPFGMNPRQQHAWMYYEGGSKLLNAFYAKHKVYGLPCGNTGNQMGGWFRKEINLFPK